MKKVLNKHLLLSSIGLVIASLVFFYIFFTSVSTSANPDFICYKSVTNKPCVIKNEARDCGVWQTNGKRTCKGIKVTVVAYHLVRTTCEAGYTKIRYGSNNGASGRHGGDYNYKYGTCTIQQIDETAPVGKPN